MKNKVQKPNHSKKSSDQDSDDVRQPHAAGEQSQSQPGVTNVENREDVDNISKQSICELNPSTGSKATETSQTVIAENVTSKTIAVAGTMQCQLPDTAQPDSSSAELQTTPNTPAVIATRPRSIETTLWEIELLKIILVPSFIVIAIFIGIISLGIAQRSGWIKPASNDRAGGADSVSATNNVSYICPMMCVPPTSKAGRCPVCAMELVPGAANASSGPSSEIQIDARSRRVAGIETVVAAAKTLSREVRVVGEISYDESKKKTLSAYVDGRIEELYADYTGVVVKKNDSLALLYSPELYGAQVEFVKMLEFAKNATASNPRIEASNQNLLSSSRERLVELGMTSDQIRKLENEKSVKRRFTLHAPISGTVIEKLAVSGQYIKSGMPIYRLADLSSVWVVLELFPADAQSVKVGQKVTTFTQSMGIKSYVGSVEFIEPNVDPVMRTVGVRVSINNEHGDLKPGEFVRATLSLPVLDKDGLNKEVVVVPRNGLLSIGQTSLAYVEINPGEFQIRHVKVGPTVNGEVAILDGIVAGENVVSRSTFLIDAQMQLQGNPSLIDPHKFVAPNSNDSRLTDAQRDEIRLALKPLSEPDRSLAQLQVICPVTEAHLGSHSMGTPIKLEIQGRTVFICCEGCRESWVNDPAKYFKILDDHAAGKSVSLTVGDDHTDKPTNTSNADLPQIDLPEIKLPIPELPNMALPESIVPESKLPEMELPQTVPLNK